VSPRCLSSTAESTFVFKYQARRPENIIHSSIEKPAFHERDTYKWWVLITVSLGSLTLALDNSILATCLPRLANAFHTDSSVIAWVNLAYFVMSQSLMLTLGKIGDAKGRKKVFIAGLTFYLVGLVACALSQNVGQLIASRAVQGIGASTGYSLSMAIAVAVFPPEERGRALGILTSIHSIGLVAGPVLGGVLLDIFGWRAVFYARAPMAIAAIIMAWKIIAEQKNSEEHFKFDIAGSVSLFGFLSSLLLFLTFGGKGGFMTPLVLFLGCLAIILLTFFLISEKKAPQPIIELNFFKKRLFTFAVITAGLMSTVAAFIIFLVPFFLMEGLGSSGSVAGIFMALLAIPLMVLSPVSGRLSDKMGPAFLSTLGVILFCISLFLLSRLGEHPTYLSIGIAITLSGVGMAIFTPPNNSAIMGSVPRSMLGTASSIAMTARQVGASSGIAVTGALFSSNQADILGRLLHTGIDLPTAKKMASVAGYQETILVGIAIACVGVPTSLVRGPRKKNHK
jgi:EmrB/QacA subfamily drug resistance transporter